MIFTEGRIFRNFDLLPNSILILKQMPLKLFKLKMRSDEGLEVGLIALKPKVGCFLWTGSYNPILNLFLMEGISFNELNKIIFTFNHFRELAPFSQ